MPRSHHHREQSGNFVLGPGGLSGPSLGHARSGSAPASLVRFSHRERTLAREHGGELDQPPFPSPPENTIAGIPTQTVLPQLPALESVSAPHDGSPRKRRDRSASLFALVTCVAATAVGFIAKSMMGGHEGVSRDVSDVVDHLPMLPGLDDEEQNSSDWAGTMKKYNAKGDLLQILVEEATRPKAAFISLVTEEDLAAAVYTVSTLEEQFNFKYGYDWVFFSPNDLSEAFRSTISNSTHSACVFEKIQHSKWSAPTHLNMARVKGALDEFARHGIDRDWMMNNHHSARWGAGLFAEEKRLDNYDWFWRIQPGTLFSKPIDSDVFRFMRDNKMTYGTDSEKVYSLHANKDMWCGVRSFVDNRPDLIHPQSPIYFLLKVVETGHDDLDVLTDEHDAYHLDWCRYSHKKNAFPARGTIHLAADAIPVPNCQDCPSFTIGSVGAFRGKAYRRFFKHLDTSGIFYYNTVTEDLVHRLAMTMFTHPRRSWFFDSIGASHGICAVCPLGLLAHKAAENEFPYDHDADTEDQEALGNESFGHDHFAQMWEEIEVILTGLEMSKLESGQTFNLFRIAEQEGVRIDINEEDEEEPILSLPDGPMEREIDFAEDVWTEQFVRSLQGGN